MSSHEDAVAMSVGLSSEDLTGSGVSASGGSHSFGWQVGADEIAGDPASFSPHGLSIGAACVFILHGI